MKSKVLNKYHLPLLACIPVVFVASFFIENGAVDIQMHDTYYVIHWLHFALAISFLLGLKSFLYYNSRNLSFLSNLCWGDIFLTLGLVAFFLYGSLDGFLNKGLGENSTIFITLYIATWVLVQLFVAVNYFILVVFGKKS